MAVVFIAALDNGHRRNLELKRYEKAQAYLKGRYPN